jgi:hypothetical protein
LIALMTALWLAVTPAASAQDAAAANPPDEKTIALSAELLDLAGLKPMLVQMLDHISPGLTQLIQQANPGKEAEVSEVMNQFVVPKMKERLPEVIREGAVIYANHFTADEIAQLIQFYQSPLGRKLAKEQPLMSQEMARVSTVWAQAVTAQAVKEYADEFRKRGLQTPI